MSDHAEGESHEKLYWMVGAALFALTIVTVMVSKLQLAHPWNYVVGLSIAALKVSLVASIFMHLKWESKVIYYVLGLTAVFAVVLFAIPIIDFSWTAPNHVPQPPPVHGAAHGEAHAEAGAEH